MKIKFFVLFVAMNMASFSLSAQNDDIEKYLKGAVPVVNHQVVFEKSYEVPGKTKEEIYLLLKQYTENEILNGENHLEQCAITEEKPEEGILAASVEEYLYFKRKAWVMHRVRFYYQLIYHINDGSFKIVMRRLNYLYDDVNRGEEEYRAEDWITDEEALSKDGRKLTRVAGKFRRFTIDRKNEIFRGAAKACGVAPKTKVIVVEE